MELLQELANPYGGEPTRQVIEKNHCQWITPKLGVSLGAKKHKMDTLSRLEIQEILSKRLPKCAVSCSINPDSTLSVNVIGPGSYRFSIINIDRFKYHGKDGINKLVREILEEIVIARRTSLR